jgi:hypothetical protein
VIHGIEEDSLQADKQLAEQYAEDLHFLNYLFPELLD